MIHAIAGRWVKGYSSVRVSCRTPNTREPFTWLCILRLGRLGRQRDVPHHLSRSKRNPRPYLHPSHPPPTMHTFIHDTLIGNRIFSRSTTGHSRFSALTPRQRYRYSTSMTSTSISKRQGSSYTTVLGRGPRFSMNQFLRSLLVSNTSE